MNGAGSFFAGEYHGRLCRCPFGRQSADRLFAAFADKNPASQARPALSPALRRACRRRLFAVHIFTAAALCRVRPIAPFCADLYCAGCVFCAWRSGFFENGRGIFRREFCVCRLSACGVPVFEAGKYAVPKRRGIFRFAFSAAAGADAALLCRFDAFVLSASTARAG